MTNPDQIEIKIPVGCDEKTVEQVKEIALSLCGAVWGYGRKALVETNETTDQHHWPTWTHDQFTYTLLEDDSQ